MNIESGYYIITFIGLLFIIGSLCLILDKPQKIVYVPKKKKPSYYYDSDNNSVIIDEYDNI